MSTLVNARFGVSPLIPVFRPRSRHSRQIKGLSAPFSPSRFPERRRERQTPPTTPRRAGLRASANPRLRSVSQAGRAGTPAFRPSHPHRERPPRGFAAQESEKRLAVFYSDRRGLVATEKPLRGIEHRLVRTSAVLLRRHRREIRTDLTAEPFDARAGGAGGGGVKNLTALARGSAVPGAEFRSVASVRGGESPSNNDPWSARSSLPPARCNWARAGPVNGGARWRSALLASVWASIAAIARREGSRKRAAGRRGRRGKRRGPSDQSPPPRQP